MKLVAGLGNPGDHYAATRHNIGFMIVENLAAGAGIALKRKGYQGLYGVGRTAGVETTLLLPQTYMNRSGASVGPACQSLGIPPRDLIVVHDEVDLPFGTLRVKVGGGHGGHNGLRSICAVLGDPGFVRVRAGIGRPPAGGDVSRFVLGRFRSEERAALAEFLETGAAAVECILKDGPQAAMNVFNRRDSTV